MSDWVVRLIEQSGYLGVGFLMFLETVFPPIPSEVIMPVAGVAAAQGKLGLWGVIVSGTAGAMLGNIIWYLAARALGIIRMKPLVERFGRWLTLNWSDVERADRWFAGHGAGFVFAGRLVPTVRSLVSIPAGLLHMRFRNFVIASTVGTAAWTAFLAIAGFRLQQNFAQVEALVGPASNAVLIVLLIGYLWRLATYKPDPAGMSDSRLDGQ